MLTKLNLVTWSLVLFFVISAIQYARIEYLEADRKALRIELDEIKADAKDLAERYRNAHNEAESDMGKDEQEEELIMLARVPKSCEASIAWAVGEAKGFNA